MKIYCYSLCLFVICLLGPNWAKSQSEAVCEFVGEIALPAATAASFYTCMQTGTPAACKIGYAMLQCQEDPACSGVVAKFTEAGCNYLVKKVGDVYRITAKAVPAKAEELRKTYQALNTIEGMRWLQRYLSR